MKNSLDNFTQASWNLGSALRHADAWVSSQGMDGIYNIPFTGVCSENCMLRLFWSFLILKNLSHKVYATSVQIWGKSSDPTLQKFYSCIELLLSVEVLLFPWVHLRRCSFSSSLIHLISDSIPPCQDPFITFWPIPVVAIGQVSGFQSVEDTLEERNHPLMHSELDCFLSCSQPALPVAIHMAAQLEKKHQENIYSFNVFKQN